MSEIKYRSAFDENNNLVDIKDVTEEDRKNHTYHCITCGEPLKARLGKERTRHFCHEKDTICDGESYLHKLAKLRLKEKFDMSKHFYISYEANVVCSQQNCRLRNIDCKRSLRNHTIDLKDYYDTATIEAPIENFIADILLTNSKDKKMPPILLEIWVNHECEQEKKDSGKKIIELHIRNESDLNLLLEKEYFRESSQWERNKSITFYSFSKEIKSELISKIYRYVMTYNKPFGYIKTIPCVVANSKLESESLHELNAFSPENSGEYNTTYALRWLLSIKGIRRCNICKFYYKTEYESKSKCRLDKKRGTPTYPKMVEAEKCPHFSQSNDYFDSSKDFIVEEITYSVHQYKKDFKVAIIHEFSFYDYELFQEKCDYYLRSQFVTSNITMIRGFSEWNLDTEAREKASYNIDLCYTYAHYRNINVVNNDGYQNLLNQDNDFEKYCEDLISMANATIVFWDGENEKIGKFIEISKKKRVPLRIVNTEIYPKEEYYY